MTEEHKVTLTFIASIEGDDLEHLPNYLKAIIKIQVTAWFFGKHNTRDVEVKIEEILK